jgi:hypothetical protein
MGSPGLLDKGRISVECLAAPKEIAGRVSRGRNISGLAINEDIVYS